MGQYRDELTQIVLRKWPGIYAISQRTMSNTKRWLCRLLQLMVQHIVIDLVTIPFTASRLCISRYVFSAGNMLCREAYIQYGAQEAEQTQKVDKCGVFG